MRFLPVCLLFVACGAQPPTPDAGAADGGRDAGHDAGHPPLLDAGGPDAGVDAGLPPPEVPAAGPLLLPTAGGPVLSDAWLVTLAYADVPDADVLAAMGEMLPDSGWLAAVGEGYGVGLRGHSHFTIPGTAPLTFQDSDVAGVVADGIDAGWWPPNPADAGTPLWVVFYPPDSGSGTARFSGEHFSSAQRVLAWVAPGTYGGGLQQYELTFAHEVIEALTDPYAGHRAWYETGFDTPFNALPGNGASNGGEVGDLCTYQPPVNEGGFWLPLSWSNASADAGYSPCAPTDHGARFATLWGPTGAVVLSPGQSAQVALQPIAHSGVTQWDVSLELVGWGEFTDATLASSRATVGTPVMLTVAALGIGSSGSSGFYRVVSREDGGFTSYTAVQVRVR